jgi:BlaI family transcriptional regulator, penicillinase repressor
MARPKTPHPTPAELEILKVLWDRGPATVRDVVEVLNQQGPPRAYTTLMSLMSIMVGKDLLRRETVGRAFLYRPAVERESTLRGLLGDLWQRAFERSTAALVSNLLQAAPPSAAELDQIRATLRQFEPHSDRSPSLHDGPSESPANNQPVARCNPSSPVSSLLPSVEPTEPRKETP